MGPSYLREVFEAMEIDAVPKLDREKEKSNEKQFSDRIDQAANDSYMETHIPSVVGTEFSTTRKGGGGKEDKRAYAMYQRNLDLLHLQRRRETAVSRYRFNHVL